MGENPDREGTPVCPRAFRAVASGKAHNHPTPDDTDGPEHRWGRSMALGAGCCAVLSGILRPDFG